MAPKESGLRGLGTMPEDIGMEMPEVDVQWLALEERAPRRLHIRSKDITKFGDTVDCKGCVATLRGAGEFLIQIRAASGLLRKPPGETKAISSAARTSTGVGVLREGHPEHR